MGDETVVAPNPSVMDYSSTGFAPTSYTNSGSNAVPDGDVFSFGGAADSTASNIKKDAPNPVPDGPDSGDRTLNNMDSSVMQDTPVSSAHGAIGAPATTENAVTQGNSEEKFNEAVSYGSSANANGVTDMRNYTPAGTGENGNASNDVLGAATEQQFEEAPAASTEEERLWSIVKTNSLDFNAWTALIEETEKVAEDNISKIQKVYDTFLAEFPLCYGYWKKYADHEGRLSSIEKVVEVYERAVEAVTYSVDIWLHYCIFAISTYGDPDAIRRLFERGLAYVGTDYLSYSFWDKYIEYEYSQQEWSRLAMIYTRILENPNQQLDRYFNSFKELAGSRPLSELRTAEEAAAVAAANVEASGGADEVRLDGVEQSTKPVSAGLSEAEELEKYIAIREEMYKKAKEYDSKIIGFETAIRRPYFHVRPLIGAELENWHNYLDFIEQQDDFNKVVKLYERCLIACANYPEYWIRYVLCMEGSGSMDLANNALARATQVFVKRQPEIHLFAARFKEQHGDIPGARAAYQLVHSGISPGLLEAVVKHANMERRVGNMEDALTLYEQAIATEKGKEQSQTLPMLFVQYSRFSFLVGGDAEKARGILIEALEHVQLSKPLLEALIHLETIQSAPKRIDYLDSLVEKFVVPSPDNPNAASTADREEISSIYLEFLDLFGVASSIKKADDRHAKLFLRHRNTSELKKRSAEDFLSSDKAKLNKSYAGVSSSAQSLMGSYPSAQNQWAAGYGLQPQAWQQAPQAQGQQWNPGYGQQAGYAAYGGYVNSYTHQQTPTSAPQSAAAYGTYPSSYPVQTFPQQSYVQPGTAASFAPAQQQAPVQQAYYGTYY